MLEFFRSHSRLMMIILFILVVPSFVFLGIADYQSFGTNEVRLVSVNEQKITQSEFNHSWTQRLNQLRQQQGSHFDLASTDTPENRRRWLDLMINNSVIQETARDDKFAGSDDMVRAALAQTPEFQENGQFSLAAYNRYLSSIGLSSQQYEASVRAYEGLQLVTAPVASALLTPDHTQKSIENAMTQERAIALRIFDKAEFANKVEVSDNDIKVWYEKNAKNTFEIPEYVNLEYVLLNKEAAIAHVPTPSDAELTTYYQSNIKRFSVQERRHIKHIQVADEATAQTVFDKIKQSPAQFDALAKEYSHDAATKNTGGDLGFLRKGDIPGTEDNAFALQQVGITQPVKLGNSYHIFNVVAIEGGEVKPFADVKNEILGEVTLQLASEKFAKMATDLTHIVQEQRQSLQPVAEELGLAIKEVKGVARSRLLSAEQVGKGAALGSSVEALFNTPRVRETAFSSEVFSQGLNSGVIEHSPSEFLVIHVKDKVATHVPSLDALKPKITTMVNNEKSLELAKKAGENFLSANTKDNQGFRDTINVSRIIGNLPDNVLNAVMQAPTDKLPVYVGATVEAGYAVARIEAVSEARPEVKTAFAQQVVPSLNIALGNEVNRAFEINLRGKHTIKILPVAEQVIAGEPVQ